MGCATRHPIEDAKAVVKSHEQFAKAGKLDEIVSNFADDFVSLVPGMPLLKGKDAAGKFYAGMLTIGKSELMKYDGAEIVGDAVILHGIGKGTLHQARLKCRSSFANNFILVLNSLISFSIHPLSWISGQTPFM